MSSITFRAVSRNRKGARKLRWRGNNVALHFYECWRRLWSVFFSWGKGTSCSPLSFGPDLNSFFFRITFPHQWPGYRERCFETFRVLFCFAYFPVGFCVSKMGQTWHRREKAQRKFQPFRRRGILFNLVRLDLNWTLLSPGQTLHLLFRAKSWCAYATAFLFFLLSLRLWMRVWTSTCPLKGGYNEIVSFKPLSECGAAVFFFFFVLRRLCARLSYTVS